MGPEHSKDVGSIRAIGADHPTLDCRDGAAGPERVGRDLAPLVRQEGLSGILDEEEADIIPEREDLVHLAGNPEDLGHENDRGAVVLAEPPQVARVHPPGRLLDLAEHGLVAELDCRHDRRGPGDCRNDGPTVLSDRLTIDCNR